MVPLHELLSRIHWDPEFGRGEFKLDYYGRVSGELVYVPLSEVRQEAGSHLNFGVTDKEGVVHSGLIIGSNMCGRTVRRFGSVRTEARQSSHSCPAAAIFQAGPSGVIVSPTPAAPVAPHPDNTIHLPPVPAHQVSARQF